MVGSAFQLYPRHPFVFSVAMSLTGASCASKYQYNCGTGWIIFVMW
jgi:hypothetical protein